MTLQKWSEPEYVEKMRKTSSKRMSEYNKSLWQDMGYFDRRMKSLLNKNKLEQDFDDATPDYICYVGNGMFWKKDSRGLMCPDFVVKGQRIVIEIYGDYWHKGQDVQNRIDRWKEIGYKCLVIWESDFRKQPEECVEIAIKFCKGEEV